MNYDVKINMTKDQGSWRGAAPKAHPTSANAALLSACVSGML